MPDTDAVLTRLGLDPASMGMAFDIGHATLEGGLSWPIQARLTEPRYSVVYVKDFRWEKQDKGWTSVWCPLGQGMVNKKFFATLAQSAYAGPIGQHHEYDLARRRRKILPTTRKTFGSCEAGCRKRQGSRF